MNSITMNEQTNFKLNELLVAQVAFQNTGRGYFFSNFSEAFSTLHIIYLFLNLYSLTMKTSKTTILYIFSFVTKLTERGDVLVTVDRKLGLVALIIRLSSAFGTLPYPHTGLLLICTTVLERFLPPYLCYSFHWNLQIIS